MKTTAHQAADLVERNDVRSMSLKELRRLGELAGFAGARDQDKPYRWAAYLKALSDVDVDYAGRLAACADHPVTAIEAERIMTGQGRTLNHAR